METRLLVRREIGLLMPFDLQTHAACDA